MDARNTSRLHLVLAGTALAAWGCDATAANQPAARVLRPADISASHVAHDGELPLRARAGAVLLQQDFAPGFGPPRFRRSDLGGRCSTPSDFFLRFGLEGQGTHLGEFLAV